MSDGNYSFKVHALRDPLQAVAAYSVRRVGLYAAYAMRVTRASDLTYRDIGFKANNTLDVDTLTSFCNGTKGYVSTWYDQTGNGYDLTNTELLSCPLIYDTTQLKTLDNKPAPTYGGASSWAALSSAKISSNWSMNNIFITEAHKSLTNPFQRILSKNNTDFFTLTSNSNGSCFQMQYSTTPQGAPSRRSLFDSAINLNTINVVDVQWDGGPDVAGLNLAISGLQSNGPIVADGSAQRSNANFPLVVGRTASDQVRFFDGYIFEIIIFNTVLTDSQINFVRQDLFNYYYDNNPPVPLPFGTPGHAFRVMQDGASTPFVVKPGRLLSTTKPVNLPSLSA
jgi:hypothetical protein